MQKIATTILLVSLLGNANAQSRFEGKELSINGFRNAKFINAVHSGQK